MLNRGGMRKVVSMAIVVGGAVLLAYGLFFHSAIISSAQDTEAVAQAETSLIKEVTVGGLKRDASGEIKKTYSGKAPKACPT